MDNFVKIQNAYEARDLSALRLLATPTCRTLNKREDYKSALMLSCNNLKHLSKIESLEAECIVLNLEDGVSKEDKPFSLLLCAIFLSHHKESSKKLVVRVNALDDGGYDEIIYLNQFMPDAIRVPKVKNKKDVESACKILDERIELHLSIETSDAWSNLSALKIDARVKAFYLGILDLFADMHLSQSIIKRDNPLMHYMLSHFLVTCKIIGVKPISFVYQEFNNLDEFEQWLILEKNIGYEAKGCISPKQVELANKMFVDEEKEIQRAKIIVRLFELHKEQGITGFTNDEYGFIDEPIYKGALAILNKK